MQYLYTPFAALGFAVGSLLPWPVLVSLQQGQIELVLMALIAWDLCQPDRRRWKGAGVGVAAEIKLVPMIFILYLVLAGKLRQAAVAAAAPWLPARPRARPRRPRCGWAPRP